MICPHCGADTLAVKERCTACGQSVAPARPLAATSRPTPLPVPSEPSAPDAGVPPANLDDSYRQPEDLLAALKSRRVGAAVMTAVWAILERKRDPELQLGLFIGAPSTVGFAVRKDSPLLLAALDEYVTNLRRTATWSRLVVKYFGEHALEILRKSRADSTP